MRTYLFFNHTTKAYTFWIGLLPIFLSLGCNFTNPLSDFQKNQQETNTGNTGQSSSTPRLEQDTAAYLYGRGTLPHQATNMVAPSGNTNAGENDRPQAYFGGQIVNSLRGVQAKEEGTTYTNAHAQQHRGSYIATPNDANIQSLCPLKWHLPAEELKIKEEFFPQYIPNSYQPEWPVLTTEAARIKDEFSPRCISINSGKPELTESQPNYIPVIPSDQAIPSLQQLNSNPGSKYANEIRCFEMPVFSPKQTDPSQKNKKTKWHPETKLQSSGTNQPGDSDSHKKRRTDVPQIRQNNNSATNTLNTLPYPVIATGNVPSVHPSGTATNGNDLAQPAYPQRLAPIQLGQRVYPQMPLPIQGQYAYPQRSVSIQLAQPAYPERSMPIQLIQSAYPQRSVSIQLAQPAYLQRSMPIQLVQSAYPERSMPIQLDQPAYLQRSVPIQLDQPAYPQRSVSIQLAQPAYLQRSVPIQLSQPAYPQTSVPIQLNQPAYPQRSVPIQLAQPAYPQTSVPIQLDQPVYPQRSVPTHLDQPTYGQEGNKPLPLWQHNAVFQSLLENLEIWKNTLDEEHPDLIPIHNNMAKLSQSQGQDSEALLYLLKVLTIQQNKLGERHPDLVPIYNNMAQSLEAQEKYDEALECLQQALAIQENTLSGKLPDLVRTYQNVARVLTKQGTDVKKRYQQALQYLAKALAIQENTLDKEHLDIAFTYRNIAQVLTTQKLYPAALEHFDKALTIYHQKLDRDHPDLAHIYQEKAQVLQIQKRYNGAVQYLEAALTIYYKTPDINHGDIIDTYRDIVHVLLLHSKEYDKACRYLDQLLTIYYRSLHDGHSNPAITYEKIHSIVPNDCGDIGFIPIALEYYQQILLKYKQEFGDDHINVANIYWKMAAMMRLTSKCITHRADAIKYYKSALAIYKKQQVPMNRFVLLMYSNIAKLLIGIGRSGDALPYCNAALEILEKLEILRGSPIDDKTQYDVYYYAGRARLDEVPTLKREKFFKVLDEAIYYFEKALPIIEKEGPFKSSSAVAKISYHMGRALYFKGEDHNGKALELFGNVLKFSQKKKTIGQTTLLVNAILTGKVTKILL